MKTRPLLLVALAAGALSPARAQLDLPALQGALDGALSATLATGGAAAIVRDGRVLWHGQSGVIAPGSATAVGPDTLFAFASVGKMTTATLALRLVEEGRLALDAPIASYLPGGTTVPGAGQVTVRHLLNHRSGYPDLYAEPSVLARLLDQDHAWSEAELLAEVREPETAPGATHSYSNTNYILLSALIAQNAGRTFGEFYDQEISGPLGLAHSFVTPRPRGDFAQGVRGAGETEFRPFELTAGVPTALYGELFGDGPLAGTAADGALFLDALVGGGVLGEAALGEMLTFDPESGYGLGITAFSVGEDIWIGHSGSWGGFTALSLYNVGQDLSFMTVANHEADAEGQPFAAVVLMNAVVAASTPIPEPAAAGGLAAVAALAFAAARRGRRAA